MIRFDMIEGQIDRLTQAFRNAEPFPFVAIDNFADEDKLTRVLSSFPTPGVDEVNLSRDYIFAKNKFEKSNFKDFCTESQELYEDLISSRFEAILCTITGETVFVDKEFHGGGMHQGGEGSFLDMHVDFNYHPLHRNWFRNLNILLYLNQGWMPEHRGQLKLKHGTSGAMTEVEPIFNRCVIMFTRDYTFHGYDPISFPPGQFRRSIAAYAYSLDENPQAVRSTLWQPENAPLAKRLIGRYWPMLVRAKNSLFGSGTAKNK